MVLIGPQASGKSTLSKLVYFFQSLKFDYMAYYFDIVEVGSKSAGNKSIEIFISRKVDTLFSSMLNKNDPELLVRYEINKSDFIEIRYDPDASLNGWVHLSDSMLKGYRTVLKKSISAYHEIASEQQKAIGTSRRLSTSAQTSLYQKVIIDALDQLFEDSRDLLFIPAARSTLITLSNLIKTNSLKEEGLDYLTKEFLHEINIYKLQLEGGDKFIIDIKNTLPASESQYATAILRLANEVLKGKYQYDKDGSESLALDNGVVVDILNASSGQQESLWIFLSLFMQVAHERDVQMFVEEPEAHLYPKAQQKLLEALVLLVNANEGQNRMIINTHSPYILTALNNLLYASRLAKKSPQSVGKIVDEKLWIDPKRVSAYLVKDGKLEDIMDREMAMIKAEKIDEASQEINEVFDQLFEMDDE